MLKFQGEVCQTGANPGNKVLMKNTNVCHRDQSEKMNKVYEENYREKY